MGLRLSAAAARPFRNRPYGAARITTLNSGRNFNTSTGTLEEGDTVILRRADKADDRPTFVKSLKRGQILGTHYGTLKHDDLFGLKNRDTITSNTGRRVRVFAPTLAEYVTLTPRVVTPIYPADANLIVSLLDIHVTPPTDSNADDPPFEILEAGTGHGSLTLHLARAIHAANKPFVPPKAPTAAISTVTDDEVKLEARKGEAATVADHAGRPDAQQQSAAEPNNSETTADNDPQLHEPHTVPPTSSPDLLAWKPTRRAIIHTIDNVRRHTNHASKTISGFRNGLYAPNIDFHTGDISTYISHRQSASPQQQPQIFQHILLDLPGVHEHIAQAASALRDDGTLSVFAPSITQIGRCVEVIRKQMLPLSYDQVVELGAGYSGGKQWDVRAVKPVKLRRAPRGRVPGHVEEAWHSRAKKGRGVEVGEVGWVTRLGRWFGFGRPKDVTREVEKTVEEEEEEWVMVCRPSVGHRVVGGGFVGLWRRKKDWGPAAGEEGGEE